MRSISKIQVLLFALIFCTAGLSAQNEEMTSEDPDSGYAELEAEELNAKKSSSKKKTNKAKKNKEKEFGSSGNKFKDFIFGKEKYIFYDEVELATGTSTFGIKPKLAQMIYNPKTEKAGIQVHYQTMFFNILVDEKERHQIIDAISLYLQDFENKKLIRNKNSKTRKIYGKGKCYVEWGTLKTMMNNYGNTKIQYGYEFKKESPYFCLIVKGTKNEQQDMGTFISPQSTEIQIYFTRAKAQAFAGMLKDELIQEQRQVYLDIIKDDDVVPVDSYSESQEPEKNE